MYKYIYTSAKVYSHHLLSTWTAPPMLSNGTEAADLIVLANLKCIWISSIRSLLTIYTDYKMSSSCPPRGTIQCHSLNGDTEAADTH